MYHCDFDCGTKWRNMWIIILLVDELIYFVGNFYNQNLFLGALIRTWVPLISTLCFWHKHCHTRDLITQSITELFIIEFSLVLHQSWKRETFLFQSNKWKIMNKLKNSWRNEEIITREKNNTVNNVGLSYFLFWFFFWNYFFIFIILLHC